MKVAHISTYDYGGAGSAALLLDQYCKSLGFDSTLYVKEVARESTSVRLTRRWNWGADFARKCLAKLARLFVDKNFLFYGLFDRYFELPDEVWIDKLKDKDVIFIYWISTFTTLTQLARVLSSFPTKVVYVVNFDMVHMTGGCHYSFGCAQFSTGCQSCPNVFLPVFRHLIQRGNMDKTIAVSSLKARTLSFTPFVQAQANQSSVKFIANYLFNLPVSISEFRPVVSAHNRTIFIGAYAPEDKRKGFDLLCRVLLSVSESHMPITLLFPVGTHVPSYIADRYLIEFYPYAKNNVDLNAVYNRASLFLNTSLDDSGPVMVLQAMLAGLPVVSHRIGYAADMVRDDENGILVDYLDVDGFADGVLRILAKWNVNSELRKRIHNDACAFSSSLPKFSDYIIDEQ